MQELFKEKLKWVIGGFWVGIITSVKLLFHNNILQIGYANMALQYFLQFFGSLFITGASISLSLVIHEYWKVKLKDKFHKWLLKKRSKYGKRKKQTEKRSEEAEEGENKKVG